ncbi:Maf family protein [Bacteriovoracaceae bacterium]|nr:Maf family protein [Bacteriovoracaceae bacterium]
MKIILASKSKYKIQELKKIIKDFTPIDPLYDESTLKQQDLSVSDLVLKLSQKKAEAAEEMIKDKYNDYLIIGADQICHLNDPNEQCKVNQDKLFSKPRNFENAKKQLQQMSGRNHFLSTGVYVKSSDGRDQSIVSTTQLTMRELNNEQITNYLDLDLPFDCAGSYKIESFGINLFTNIVSPDFTGIIGIPLLQLSNLLRDHFELDLLGF